MNGKKNYIIYPLGTGTPSWKIPLGTDWIKKEEKKTTLTEGYRFLQRVSSATTLKASHSEFQPSFLVQLAMVLWCFVASCRGILGMHILGCDNTPWVEVLFLRLS